MRPRCIEPARRPVDADFWAVPSKSWTHRALVAAALGDGSSRIEGPLDAADTRRTKDGLRSLGVRIDEDAAAWVVHGQGGAIAGGAVVDCGASGTTARFLTALAARGERPSRIDGTARLRERPMGDLTGALRALGAAAESPGAFLPVTVGGALFRGGAVAVPGERSSQFASALLLVAACCPDGIDLEVRPPRAAFSYTLLTAEVLGRFGVEVARRVEGCFSVAPQPVRCGTLSVEGDHSSAAYLLLAAAITGGRVRVRGLRAASLQPDARFPRDLEGVGCKVTRGADEITVAGAERLESFDWDLEDAPDLAPTAAVLALFARGASRLRGLSNLRAKESDRLSVLEGSAARLGAHVRVEGESLIIGPPPGGPRGTRIDVAGDHRIAMAFAVAGLRVPGITLSDGSAVEKSYPGFWRDHARLSGDA